MMSMYGGVSVCYGWLKSIVEVRDNERLCVRGLYFFLVWNMFVYFII